MEKNTYHVKGLTSHFYNAQEVSQLLGISLTSAYRIIKSLNDSLKAEGYIVIPGKIGRLFLEKKIMF